MTSFQTVMSRNAFVKDSLGFTNIDVQALLNALGCTYIWELCRGRAIKYNPINDIVVCYISMTSKITYRDYAEDNGFVMYQGEGLKGDQVMTHGNRLLAPEHTIVLLVVCTGNGNWFYRTGVRVEAPRYEVDGTGRHVYHFKIQLM